MGSTITAMFSSGSFTRNLCRSKKGKHGSAIFQRKDTATAIGNYSAFQSFFTMLASSLTDLVSERMSLL
jgi:hypothetical protein